MKLLIRQDSFLSHFVPGFSVLIYFISLIYNWDFFEIIMALKQKSEMLIFIGFGLLVISYAFGLILDAIRDILENLFDLIPNFKVNWDFFFNETKAKQDKLTKWYFPWYVFNVNTLIGLTVSILICRYYHYHYSPISNLKFHYGILFGLAILIILLIDSIVLRFDIIKHTNKGLYKSNLPDFNVYTRIMVSERHGVGVFAISDIKKGTYIFLENCETIKIKANKLFLQNKSVEINQLYNDFCPKDESKGIYYCPENFNFMTISWYLNEDNKNPNVACDKDFEFYAIRDINKGEELLANYDLIDSNV